MMRSFISYIQSEMNNVPLLTSQPLQDLMSLSVFTENCHLTIFKPYPSILVPFW